MCDPCLVSHLNAVTTMEMVNAITHLQVNNLAYEDKTCDARPKGHFFEEYLLQCKKEICCAIGESRQWHAKKKCRAHYLVNSGSHRALQQHL